MCPYQSASSSCGCSRRARLCTVATSSRPVGLLLPAPMTPICLVSMSRNSVSRCDPLLKQRLAVHEHERRASAGGDQVRRDHCLPDPRRRAQHSEARAVSTCAALAWARCSSPVNRVSSSIPSVRSSATPADAETRRADSSSGERAPRGSTRNWPCCSKQRSHAACDAVESRMPLTLQEQGVRERREPAHRIDQRRGQLLSLRHVQPLRERRAENVRHRRRGESVRKGPGRAPRRLTVDRLPGDAEPASVRVGPSNKILQSGWLDARQRPKVGPLILERLKPIVDEQRIPLPARPVLQGNAIRFPKPPFGSVSWLGKRRS